MDTVENVRKELEKCIGTINAAGLGSLDPESIVKLDALSEAAAGLGMSQGKKLIDNLSAVLKSFREGKSAEGSVSVRMTALDFYLGSIQSGDSTEEL